MFGAASISALTVPHIDRRSVGAAIVDLARTGKRREPFATHCIERLIGLAEAFRRLRKTRGSDDRTFAAGNGHVTEHLVVRRMPRRQAHDDAREVGALAAYSSARSARPARAAAMAAGTANVMRQPGQVSSGPRTASRASSSACSAA